MTRAVTLARKDTSVVVMGTMVTNAARLCSTIILTRMLDAGAYGVVGILTSIGFAVVLLSDVGIYGYVVRHSRGMERIFLDQVWTLRMLRSFALTGTLFLLAPLLAYFLQKPIAWPLMVYALTFSIEGLSSMAFATAPRQRQIRRLAALDVIPQLLAIPIAVGLALLLRSYWALVIAMVASSCMTAILSYALFPYPRRHWHFDRERARELWHFGRALNAASVIQLILMQTDKVVLARVLPLATFGLYTIATTLVTAIRMFNNNYVKRILFPSFAAVKDMPPSAQSSIFYSTGWKVRLLYAFAAGGFVACAPLVIKLLYDPRYADAAMFLQLLAIGNIVSMSCSAANEMLMALGRTRHIFHLNLVRLAFLVSVGTAGFLWLGPIGLVAAVAGCDLAAQVYAWHALRQAGIFDLRRELTQGLAAALGFGLGLCVNVAGTMLVK